MNKTKIGVFDSGVGGMSVVHAIREAMPELDVMFANDSQHVPYGDKPPSEILKYSLPILKDMESRGCRVIVIACNTLSTLLIEELRRRVQVPLIGLEPMVKTAAKLTKSGIIVVCATPGTLGSKRYGWLKETYAHGMKVIEPDCSKWSTMIETNKVDHEHIAEEILPACRDGADVIVLGCTHYHWIEEEIEEMVAGKAVVLQPERPVVARLKKVLSEQ